MFGINIRNESDTTGTQTGENKAGSALEQDGSLSDVVQALKDIFIDETGNLSDNLQQDFAQNFDKNAEFFRERNKKELTFHNQVHFGVVEEVCAEILSQLGYQPDQVSILSKLLAQGHDLVVGGRGVQVLKEQFNINLPSPLSSFADEIASALLLPQILEKDLSDDIKNSRQYKTLIAQIQRAILSTTVNRQQVAPAEFGGTSTITQFELAKHKADLPETHNGQKINLQRFVEVVTTGFDDKLANALCAGDLGHFALQEENKFWEMCFRYGMEVAGLNQDSGVEAIKGFIEGQIAYLQRYNYPADLPQNIRRELDSRKTDNINRIKQKLETEDLQNWAQAQISQIAR